MSKKKRRPKQPAHRPAARPGARSMDGPTVGVPHEPVLPPVLQHQNTSRVKFPAGPGQAIGRAGTRPPRVPAPPAAQTPAPTRGSALISFGNFTCGQLEDTEPHALALTYRLDVPVRTSSVLTLDLIGLRCPPYSDGTERDAFSLRTGEVPVLPGAGTVSLTQHVTVAPGEWDVRAYPTLTAPGEPPEQLAEANGHGYSNFAPVMRLLAPGAHLFAWPALVALGTLVALVVQWLLTSYEDLPSGRVLAVTSVACLLGAVGAKAYFQLTHRDTRPSLAQPGMSVQGFVLVAVAVLAAGSWLAGIGVGRVLDATAPGLLFGMAIGRTGCFCGGCCVGRPTASRWGVWSSDKRIGMRRIPVQLMESTGAALIAVTSLGLALTTSPPVDGMVFAGTIASNVLLRQLLFPLRYERRKTRHGRNAAMIGAVTLLLADAAWAVVA